MEIYNKNGLLFIIQIDHLSGELIGALIDYFYEAGAKNVQVIPTVTKKNRPAHVFLVDGNEKSADKIESVIIHECGSSGWHRVETHHRHTDVTLINFQIEIRANGSTFKTEVAGKQIANDKSGIRPEYESCKELKEKLSSHCGETVSIRHIYTALTELFKNDHDKLIIEGGIVLWKKAK